MFTVPEVDDDAETSPPADVTKVLTATEAPKEPPPEPPGLVPSTEKKEDVVVEIQSELILTSPAEKDSTNTATTRQHVSRLTHFHRNTVHGGDSIDDRTTSHQQHHSAPPAHNQQSKTGLDAINENGEDSSPGDRQSQQKTTHPRFPRSSTVPYPAYATVRKTASHYIPPTYYYYTEDGQFDGRQPLPIINTGFQPISPHHPQYISRPVDVLKPTFLIVPKATEQRLIAQLSASNSPVLTANKTKSTTKVSQKSPTTTRATEDPTPTGTNESPTKNVMDIAHQHIGLLATPNPSPYVHFVHVPQSPELPAQEGPPETTIMQDEFSNLQEYQQPQPSTSIRSMPNIALAQVSPHHLYGSPSLRHYYLAQQPTDEQQILTTSTTESTNGGIRSATVPQMPRTTDGRIGEMDESSLASFDLAHTDIIDMPGSWRYQPVPIRTIARRYRQPIPQSFLDSQQYVSDSEQILHSSSYRQPQLFGSIPTINRPFDSIRSLQPIAFPPSIRLSDKDILKIAAFYKSMGTLVYVAHSTATLYSSDFDSMANLKDWKKLYTGVPIWLFNTGMNPKRARSIRLIISELGSSFTLWDTIVNGASDVRLPKSRHITLKSLETGAVLALKFDDTNATDEFHQYFVKLSCDPRNADLFDVFNSKRRRPVFVLRKKKIRKSAISKPSHFNHITKVDEHDRDSLYTFSVLVDDAIVPLSPPPPPHTTTTTTATAAAS